MARSGIWASAFGKFATALPSPASDPPNKSFKPTPHRGVNSVLYATLHAVATPLWGGLTPALGGEKRSAVVLFAAVTHRLRLALLFGYITGALPLRLSLQDALTHRMCCVRWLRKRRLACVEVLCSRCSRFGNVRLKVPGCAPKPPGFGFRQVRYSFTIAGFLPA